MKLFFAATVAAFLALFLAPFPGWFDSGEFAAALDGLGVSHPSGHPLYLLLGKPFTWIPFGSVAYRTSLFSVVCAAASAVLLWKIFESLNGRASWAGAVFAFLALLHPSIALQIVRTEVYAPQFCLSLVSIWLLLEAHERDDARLAFFSSLALGFSVALQPLLGAVLVPLLLYACLFFRPRRWMAPGAVFFALGLLVYLYLPLRATQNPFVNWDAPETWSRFWLAFTAWDYQEFFHHPWSSAALRDWEHADILKLLPLPLLLAAGVGLLAGSQTLFILSAIFLGLTPWLAKDFYLGNPDSHAYVMLPVALLILLAGVALSKATGWLSAQFPTRGLNWAPYAILAAVAIPLATGPLSPFRSGNVLESEALSRHVDFVPPRAAVTVGSDHWLFPLWYRTSVEGRRPDVAILGKGMLDASWYVRQIEKRYAPIEHRPLFLEHRDSPASLPSGFLVSTEPMTIIPAASDFIVACRGIHRFSDPFSIRRSLCAQVILIFVEQIRSDNEAAILGLVHTLEAFLGTAPSEFNCPYLQTLVLPFPLYEGKRFLAHPDQPVTALARFYMACRQPGLARSLLNSRSIDVNGQLLAAALAYQAGDVASVPTILQPKAGMPPDERKTLLRALEILTPGT